jgi:hypothetical protein
VTIPVGCESVSTGTSSGAATTDASGPAYQQALQSQSAAEVTAFIETYSRSPQSASLLNAMPPSTLADVPRSSVVGLSPSVRRQLDDRVLFAFAISESAVGDSNGGSNGRSGS